MESQDIALSCTNSALNENTVHSHQYVEPQCWFHRSREKQSSNWSLGRETVSGDRERSANIHVLPLASRIVLYSESVTELKVPCLTVTVKCGRGDFQHWQKQNSECLRRWKWQVIWSLHIIHIYTYIHICIYIYICIYIHNYSTLGNEWELFKQRIWVSEILVIDL